jgi:hypothetical protein
MEHWQIVDAIRVREGNTERRLKDSVRIQGELSAEFIAMVGMQMQIDGSTSAALQAANWRGNSGMTCQPRSDLPAEKPGTRSPDKTHSNVSS